MFITANDLVPSFSEEHITPDLLDQISQSGYIERLVPKPLGTQIKLKQKLHEYFKEASKVADNTPVDVISEATGYYV